MAIDAMDLIKVQGDAAMCGQGLEKFAHQFGIKLTNLLSGEYDIPHKEGTAREVKRATDLRVIHRQGAFAIAADALFVAHRLGQSLAKGDAYILDGMVIIDMHIAGAAHRHVDQRVARQLIEHMVEETDASFVVVAARSIEIEGDDAVKMQKILDVLEDLDDVQEIYHNAAL